MPDYKLKEYLLAFNYVSLNILSSFSYIDQIADGSIKYYTYAVTANSNGKVSDYSASNGVVI